MDLSLLMETWLVTFRREAVSFGGRLLLDFTADKRLALVPFIRGTVSSFVVFSAFFSSISTGEGVCGLSGLSTEPITNIKPTTITTITTPCISRYVSPYVTGRTIGKHVHVHVGNTCSERYTLTAYA